MNPQSYQKSNPEWLEWATRLQAIAQNGLTYTENDFDRERYHAVQAVAVAILAAQGQYDGEHYATLLGAEAGYATPKLDARAAVIVDGRILLVRERSDGGWTLPGGWVDVGESPRAAVEREAREESGYEARAVKLLAVWDRNRHDHPPHLFHIYKLIFRCELVGGAPTTTLETDGVGFFAPDALPPLSLGRVTPAQIARIFEHERHPEWPADFD
jgi:ADP-ribose pyrophosphatase YjhB (NUDIX family)